MKLGYVTTPFFGTRRKVHPLLKRDRLFYVKKHLEYLSKQTIGVDRVYFVCTFSNEKGIDVPSILQEVNDLCKNDDRFVIVERENLGASYASWKHGLHMDNGDCDYMVLVEDDYCLYDENSIDLMLEYFRNDEDLFYLCQYWLDEPRLKDRTVIESHASMASGMINNKKYFDLRKNDGLDLNIIYEDTYKSFCDNQAMFLEEYRKTGLKIVDWTKDYSSYFPSRKIEFGNKNGKKLMIPLEDDLGYF